LYWSPRKVYAVLENRLETYVRIYARCIFFWFGSYVVAFDLFFLLETLHASSCVANVNDMVCFQDSSICTKRVARLSFTGM
jgi:hypothetical protein